MDKHVTCWLVERGPVFDLCKEWLTEYFAAIDRAREFAKRHDMESFYYNTQSGRFTAGQAKRGVEYPDWTKPKGSDRLCWPKKKTATYEEYKAQKGTRSFCSALEEMVGKIPSTVSYKSKTSTGSGVVGGFFSPGCYTFNGVNGPFLIDIPDVHGYFAAKKADTEYYPDVEWTNFPGDPLQLPECRVINIKEWEILKFQHEMKAETASATP